MRRLPFIFLLVVTVTTALAAWHWRNGRVAATARLQRALAVRPVATVVQVPVAPPAPAAKKPLVPVAMTEAMRAEYREAMQPEAILARRAKNPRLSELHAKTLRLEFLLKNGAFLRGRKVAEADRERLLAAWIARELDMLDVQVLWRDLGMPVSDRALQTERDAAERRMLEIETAVLGPEGVEALTEYRHGQPIRDAVMNLQGEAVLAGHPLTLEQTDSVAAILASSGSRPGRPVRYLNQIDTATAERLLASVLSPEQLELLLLPLRGSLASTKFSSMVIAIRQREADGSAATTNAK